jgi:hypothetical protein
VYYNCVKFHKNSKLYTVVIHYLQMCMKEYGSCQKFGRGDNLTYTLKYVMYGEMGLQAQLLLNGSLDCSINSLVGVALTRYMPPLFMKV